MPTLVFGFVHSQFRAAHKPLTDPLHCSCTCILQRIRPRSFSEKGKAKQRINNSGKKAPPQLDAGGGSTGQRYTQHFALHLLPCSFSGRGGDLAVHVRDSAPPARRQRSTVQQPGAQQQQQQPSAVRTSTLQLPDVDFTHGEDSNAFGGEAEEEEEEEEEEQFEPEEWDEGMLEEDEPDFGPHSWGDGKDAEQLPLEGGEGGEGEGLPGPALRRYIITAENCAVQQAAKEIVKVRGWMGGGVGGCLGKWVDAWGAEHDETKH